MSEEAAPAEGAAAAPAKAPSPWLPIIVVVVLMPVISWASTQFLILPKIRGASAEHAAEAESAKGGGHGAKAEKPAEKGGHGKEGGHGGKGEEKGMANGKFAYDFDNVVVNLAGAMGTRYLKASFTCFSANPDLKKSIEENKKQLLDVAITVLGSRTMADLENGGAKNLVRNGLMANFNQALSSDLIEQIYFSEFVVQ